MVVGEEPRGWKNCLGLEAKEEAEEVAVAVKRQAQGKMSNVNDVVWQSRSKLNDVG